MNEPDQKLKRAQGTRNLARLLLGFAAAIFALGAWTAVEGVKTLWWPRAPAKIVEAGRREIFKVYYSYEVGDRQYFTDRIEPYNFGMQNAAGARRMQERFRAGAAAEVAYDPDDPKIAYLVPGPSSFSYGLMGIGCFIGLCGLLVRRMARLGIGAKIGDGRNRETQRRLQ